MKKFGLKVLTLALILAGASYAHATACGTTTVSSTGLVDSDSLTWVNGTYVANLVLPPGVFYSSAMACTTAGNTFNTQYTGTLNGSGALSVALPANTNLAPGGSQWAITLCPNATRGCFTYTITATGSTQNITTALNAVLPGPRFNGSQYNYGYGTVELNTSVTTGSMFLNTSNNQLQVYNGTAWQNFQSVLSINTLGNILNTSSLFQDDFTGFLPGTTGNIGQLGWDSTVIVTGTNPVAAAASVANHPGLITLTTNTTATNGVAINLGHGVGVLFPGNSTNWQSEQIVEINQIATGSYRIGFGTVNAATAIPTNGIYFRFLQGTDTFINACSDSTGTETCTPTTITPTAADYIDFFMNSTVTGTVNFTVVDVTTPATSTVSLCASGCTGTATLPTVVLSPLFNIVETGSSAVDILTVDYFAYTQTVIR